MKKSVLNVPNTLSIIRVLLVPVFILTLVLMRNIEIWGLIVPSAIFAVTAFTDMLDGKIARKYNLVTNFGKFIDPLADKFMIIGSQIAILAHMFLLGENTEALIFMIVVLIILFRELGVTSLRLLVAGNAGIVVPANMLGKIKTVSQMVGSVVVILEPLVFPFCKDNHIIAYVCMAIMALTTLVSGIIYFKAYIPYINTNK